MIDSGQPKSFFLYYTKFFTYLVGHTTTTNSNCRPLNHLATGISSHTNRLKASIALHTVIHKEEINARATFRGSKPVSSGLGKGRTFFLGYLYLFFAKTTSFRNRIRSYLFFLLSLRYSIRHLWSLLSRSNSLFLVLFFPASVSSDCFSIFLMWRGSRSVYDGEHSRGTDGCVDVG